VQTSLSLAEPEGRLAGLLREHDRLLEKIRKTKKAICTLDQRIDDATRRLAAAHTLVEECRRLDHEIHTLFAELLARRRQPRETRGVVMAVYQMLQRAEVLSARASRNDLPSEPPDFFSDLHPPFGESSPGDTWAGRPGGAGGYSARRPGDDSDNQSIRSLFRDLATALHPDKVPDEAEKARRTELMKEISRAYEEGDLARLLDLRRVWTAGGAVALAPDDPQHRCAKLERMNQALRQQLRELTEESKVLRQSPRAQVLHHLERVASQEARSGRQGGKDGQDGHGGGRDPVAAIIAQAQDERDRMRELRDFVVSFRDGRITVDGFAQGPQSMRTTDPFAADHEPDDDWDHELHEPGFLEFVESMLGSAMDPPPRAGRRRRGRGRRSAKRAARATSIPF